MKINQYLSELLFQRDSVILPGFGEFRTQTKTVEKLPSGEMSPPAKSVSFNPSVKANDYVLAKYIADKEKLSIYQGNEQLKSYVTEIKDLLEKEKKILIPGIGNFFLDESENLVFEPDLSVNFETSSFGLDPVIAGNPQPFEQPPPTDIPITTEKVQTKRKSSLIWFILIILLLFGAVILAYLNQDTIGKYYTKVADKIFPAKEQSNTVSNDSVVPQEQLQPVADAIDDNTADSVSVPVPDRKDHLTADIATEKKTSPDSDPAKQQITESAVSGNYGIIAGCFGQKANAENMVSQLKSQGFHNASIQGQTPSGLFRVSAGIYNSSPEAKKVLSKASAENKLQNAWIIKF